MFGDIESNSPEEGFPKLKQTHPATRYIYYCYPKPLKCNFAYSGTFTQGKYIKRRLCAKPLEQNVDGKNVCPIQTVSERTFLLCDASFFFLSVILREGQNKTSLQPVPEHLTWSNRW